MSFTSKEIKERLDFNNKLVGKIEDKLTYFSNQKKQLLLHNVSNCASGLKETIKLLKLRMKEYEEQPDYVEYLRKAIVKMQSALLYAQEIKRDCC